LHVLGRRADGYHELESLVAFAAVGDELTLEPGEFFSLAVTGEGAEAIGAGADNLVSKAVAALARRCGGIANGRFHLEKNLPVASGIGGGSSDAAAAIRLLAQVNGMDPDSPLLREVAAEIGADVPVCLAQSTRMMRGIGADLGAVLPLAPVPAVLVNSGVPVETAAVFKALGLQPGERCAAHASPGLPAAASPASLAAMLKAMRNDLTAPAMQVAPVIADAVRAVENASGCLISRMSGSGATVFGLFETPARAEEVADIIQAAWPGWWVRSTTIGG
ncbi:MAG TPA: 4-(cytidine 5'-diphospho)-2-C-methyl-D-erythritol kinase, partial [Saliniramus sp.]|nr:4-(cytidine 5'-diphospho)-2-C-methyl-D-erythritol kinase [Saliniramus sp.]